MGAAWNLLLTGRRYRWPIFRKIYAFSPTTAAFPLALIQILFSENRGTAAVLNEKKKHMNTRYHEPEELVNGE